MFVTVNLRRVLAALLFYLLAAPAVFGQITAALRGRVLDASGAAIPGAHIDLTAAATAVHQQTVTSATGDYLFVNLNPGVLLHRRRGDRVQASATNRRHHHPRPDR